MDGRDSSCNLTWYLVRGGRYLLVRSVLSVDREALDAVVEYMECVEVGSW